MSRFFLIVYLVAFLSVSSYASVSVSASTESAVDQDKDKQKRPEKETPSRSVPDVKKVPEAKRHPKPTPVKPKVKVIKPKPGNVKLQRMIARLTYFLVIALSFVSIQLWAQSDSTHEGKSITLAALYQSNIEYYGQITTEKYPYALLNATISWPSGIYFSAGTYKLFNDSTSFLSEADVSLGYIHEFSDWFSAGALYSRYFYPKNSPLLQASNTNNINFSSIFSYQIYQTDLEFDYSFGSSKDVFLSLSQSATIGLGSLSEADVFIFEPGLKATAGSRDFYRTYITKKNNNKGKGQKPPQANNGGKEIVVMEPATDFDMLAYQVEVPLSYSRSAYLIELSYQLAYLAHQPEEGMRRWQSFFGLGLYYQF